MSNSTEFINKIQDSFSATWVNKTLNTMTTQQVFENEILGSGNITISAALTQDIQGEQVNEAVQSTDVIKTLTHDTEQVAPRRAVTLSVPLR